MDRQSIMELCTRAQHACEDLAAIQQTLDTTRQETVALLAKAQYVSSLDPYSARAQPPAEFDRTPGAVAQPNTGVEVFQIMRTLLDGLPVARQITIVKALTARTMVIVATQLGASSITSST